MGNGSKLSVGLPPKRRADTHEHVEVRRRASQIICNGSKLSIGLPPKRRAYVGRKNSAYFAKRASAKKASGASETSIQRRKKFQRQDVRHARIRSGGRGSSRGRVWRSLVMRGICIFSQGALGMPSGCFGKVAGSSGGILRGTRESSGGTADALGTQGQGFSVFREASQRPEGPRGSAPRILRGNPLQGMRPEGPRGSAPRILRGSPLQGIQEQRPEGPRGSALRILQGNPLQGMRPR